MASTIAGALGLRDDRRPALDQIVDHLADRETVLVVDNCEHLIAAAADAVGALMTACATRDGHRDQPRTPRCGGRDTVAGSEAVGSRTGPAQPGGAARVRSGPALRRPCLEGEHQRSPSAPTTRQTSPRCVPRLDGIPLAIELAAARVRMLSVRQIRDGLSDRFQLLTGGARTAMPRHQTLRASVDWSVDLLGDGERRLLARLSVFAGGFTLDAARGVATGGSVGEDDVLDLLTGLVDRSLVQTDDDPWVDAVSPPRDDPRARRGTAAGRRRGRRRPRPPRRLLPGARRDHRAPPRRPRPAPLGRGARTGAGEPPRGDPLVSRSSRTARPRSDSWARSAGSSSSARSCICLRRSSSSTSRSTLPARRQGHGRGRCRRAPTSAGTGSSTRKRSRWPKKRLSSPATWVTVARRPDRSLWSGSRGSTVTTTSPTSRRASPSHAKSLIAGAWPTRFGSRGRMLVAR